MLRRALRVGGRLVLAAALVLLPIAGAHAHECEMNPDSTGAASPGAHHAPIAGAVSATQTDVHSCCAGATGCDSAHDCTSAGHSAITANLPAPGLDHAVARPQTRAVLRSGPILPPETPPPRILA